MITTREDPVIFEVTTTLREWHKIWISLYLENNTELFVKIGNLIENLIDLRAELLTSLKQNSNGNNLSQDATGKDQQIVELKVNIVSKLDIGNRLLNLDLVPRDINFKLVDPVELSPVKLYQLHLDTASKNSTTSDVGFGSELNGFAQGSAREIESYHLQLALKNYCLASLPPDELVEVNFSIVDTFNNNNIASQIKPLTEKFLVQIKNDELVCGVPTTIFTNLGPLYNRDIYLYIQVYRVGKMTLLDGHKTTTFGKQQSSQNLPVNVNRDGSTNSINSGKYTPNGLSRSRHSATGYFDNNINLNHKYRRPFGSTTILLKECSKSINFRETNINVRVISSNESGFSHLNDLYSKRNHTLKVNQNLPNVQFDLSFRFLVCAQESIPRATTIVPYCLTEKRDFPDVVMPGDFKNDLHFTLEGAEFEKGGKSISKNIEASISLIDRSGLVIKNCISPGSNCDNVSSYESCVFYHSNTPKWNESIKINVPLFECDRAHIRIEFRHCSTKERDKKFLGFSFLPLSDEDGTVIGDRTHELFLYKPNDSHPWEDESTNLCKYLSLPYGPAAEAQSKPRNSQINNFTHSNREIVTVSTFLLSTKLTQNSNLLNLLKWRELIQRKNNDFEEALKKFLDLKGEEIVKFLQDILDTLFDTFTLFLTSEDDKSSLIFKLLIHIFLLLDEPKYRHFKPVLDTYASAHFSATLVYKGLLALFKNCLDCSSDVDRHVQIQRCFKSIKYIFQFVVQSKLLYSKATGEQNDEPFLNDLRHLFKQFELMLADSNPKLIPIQMTFLESFPGALEQLIKVMNPLELAKVVTSLAGSVGFRLPPALSKAKLVFMRETANSELLKNRDVRIQITENFCRHLDCYIKHSEELELCHQVLEILIVTIHDSHWPSIYRLYQLTLKSNQPDLSTVNSSVMTVGEINTLVKPRQVQTHHLDQAIMNVTKEVEPFVNILEPLLHLLDILVRNPSSDQKLVQRYCTCILTILKLMGKNSFEQFVRRRGMDFSKLCNLFRSFRAVYNRDWSVMQLTSHSILEHPINEISKDIRMRNVSPNNRQLSSYVKLIVDFINHSTLQLETFSDRKKNYVLSVFGDLRIKFSAQLIQFWQELTPAIIYDMIPTSIQSFLNASLLPNVELQQRLIPVFYDMIDAEDQHKSNSRHIERCLMDNIDLFMNLNRGNPTFIENFDIILKRMIENKKPSWNQRGLKIINSFTKLMHLIVNYRQSLENHEHRNRQMSCLVELLNFYKDQDRTDLHLKYLLKLSDMHIEGGNYVEAAFTLKLYTDEMKFHSKILPVLDGYRPEEQEWRRKEVLYLKIIQYFDLGKCWEEAIGLCKELAFFYENSLVDYEKVSGTLKKLAQFLDNILTEHRPEREYFRVEFIGTDLPEFVRNKEFIYRGEEYERLAAFMQRMLSEFPEAKILNFKSKQSVAKDSPGQFMVISNVKPVAFLQEHLKSSQRNINDKIVQYYLNNRVDTFSYDVPIMKSNFPPSEKSSEMNVKNLWVGRYTLTVKKQLPDILPWSEIVSQEYIEISPIDHAIETISKMNVELIKLIQSYNYEPNQQISPLTMRLQGVIEAAVNGGPSVFVNAFLKSQPGETGHHDADSSARLRDLIKTQFTILEKGLALHAKLAPPEVMPLHARLVERHRAMNERKSCLSESL